jgi:hypothetical protein
VTRNQCKCYVFNFVLDRGWNRGECRSFLRKHGDALRQLPFTAEAKAQIRAEVQRWEGARIVARPQPQPAVRPVFCANDCNARNRAIIAAYRALRKSSTHLGEPSDKVSEWRLKPRQRK